MKPSVVFMLLAGCIGVPESRQPKCMTDDDCNSAAG